MYMYISTIYNLGKGLIKIMLWKFFAHKTHNLPTVCRKTDKKSFGEVSVGIDRGYNLGWFGRQTTNCDPKPTKQKKEPLILQHPPPPHSFCDRVSRYSTDNVQNLKN